MKVLLIEDDREIIEAISLAFQIRWPEAKVVSTRLGKHGVELVETESPDIVILDLGLPDINGFEVLQQIRLFSHVPTIILTVRSDETDVVKGLEWGADDYITKPFRQMELLARVKALIRRRSPSEEEQLVYGRLRLDVTTGQLYQDGKEIALTVTESHILGHLMRNGGRVVTHSSLAEAVWGDDYPGAADSLKVHIRRLREKIEATPGNPKIILTRPGVGYFLAKPE
ncbi:MAG: response regulator transcription factor [Chloroflexi bacterium]|nr:response regulator transcription factor [Chloroflexota bacterium]MBI2979754.1 response regulator transcription factor [Chloroflexota bacterium]